MTLAEVDHFVVPLEIVTSTEEALREAGAEGYELFVLWAGNISDRTVMIASYFIPEQTSYKTPDGLLVRVEGRALHELNASLFDRKEILVAQIHAHPTDAFHSFTDSTYPIVTSIGGLSIVAPYFAEDGLFVKDAATYRLDSKGWSEIRGRRLRKLISVV